MRLLVFSSTALCLSQLLPFSVTVLKSLFPSRLYGVPVWTTLAHALNVMAVAWKMGLEQTPLMRVQRDGD